MRLRAHLTAVVLFLAAALLAAPASAAIPSRSELPAEALFLPQLPSALEAAAQLEEQRQACGVFCAEVKLGRHPSAGLFRTDEREWPLIGSSDPPGPSNYAKARYYDPKIGRFITADSHLGEISDPPSLHRYVYAMNRPTVLVDPTGNFSVKDFLKGAVNVVMEPFRQAADVVVAGVATHAMGIDAEDIEMTSMLGRSQHRRVLEGQGAAVTAVKGVGEGAFAMGTFGVGPAAVSHVQLARAYSRGEISIDQYDAALSEMAGGLTVGVAIAKAGGRQMLTRETEAALSVELSRNPQTLNSSKSVTIVESSSQARGYKPGDAYAAGEAVSPPGMAALAARQAMQEAQAASQVVAPSRGFAAGERMPNARIAGEGPGAALRGGSDFVPSREIALGRDPYFKSLAEETGAAHYRQWAERGITRRSVRPGGRFGRAFHQAAERSEKIHFALDDIADPIAAVGRGAAGFRPGNFTNAELHYIANNPELLGKTVFYRGGQVVESPFTR